MHRRMTVFFKGGCEFIGTESLDLEAQKELVNDTCLTIQALLNKNMTGAVRIYPVHDTVAEGTAVYFQPVKVKEEDVPNAC